MGGRELCLGDRQKVAYNSFGTVEVLGHKRVK